MRFMKLGIVTLQALLGPALILYAICEVGNNDMTGTTRPCTVYNSSFSHTQNACYSCLCSPDTTNSEVTALMLKIDRGPLACHMRIVKLQPECGIVVVTGSVFYVCKAMICVPQQAFQ